MKQYFTGFFTAVCLTTSIFLFMGSQDRNLGDIAVNSITVYDNDGKKSAFLGNDSSLAGDPAHLSFYRDNEIRASIGEAGDENNSVIMSNWKGGSIMISGGRLLALNKNGDLTVNIGTNPDDGIGFCNIFNPSTGDFTKIIGSGFFKQNSND